ncbi:MAG: LPS export ABC transporter permease LptF [Methylobacter sp.]|nr:LPS export ABC transporter permease LptF [Methylobacter sp.]MDP2100756.1 LPS export ABC transporter permease LptF [Methylobacter sp.]MDP2429898.1 LPS export ABC transporter permease LptF [Methylobacter sp.]MDP3056085.1 LPS export ABC transporter permease LptF [Methylobacter sp.]MDP3362855.1 LPS export ABC transporter permease LptF [Methylobacter sp.]
MVASDLLRTLLAVWSVIVVIIVSRQFIRILDKAVEGQVSNQTLMTVLGLKTVIASATFLPAALFMAVLMVLGRMYRDQEMSAVASAGGGSGTVYRAVFLLVFPLSMVSAGLSLYVSPWAEAMMDQIMHQDKESADLRGIAAGKFSEYSHGDLVFYVEKIDANKKMQQVFVQHRQGSRLAIINAESGRLEDLPDGRYVILENGERVQGQPGALNYTIEQFAEYAVRVDSKESSVNFGKAAIASNELMRSEQITDIAELQRRFSIPVGVMLLTFIAVPLAQMSPRGGVYGNMLVGFLIYFSYGNLIRVSQSWVMNQTIPPWLGTVGVNTLLLVIGGVLLARLYGWQWLLMKIKQKVTR